MLIRLGYDIRFDIAAPLTYVAQLKVHPSRVADLREPDFLKVESSEFGYYPAEDGSNILPTHEYIDSYGNICTRFTAPRGHLKLSNSTLIEDSGLVDPVAPDAREIPTQDLPDDVLRFLLASRYCETDLLAPIAFDLFGKVEPGWNRVQAICDWVQSKVTFNYGMTRPTKTALDVFTERVGVCRDFQHLAVAFCRCLNIPARYVAGYLGDIRVPLRLPMDFSAWFEVYLENQWWAFDARNNTPRIGRVLMATGRDAADVAFLTSFGTSVMTNFFVVSDEVIDETGQTVQPPVLPQT
jgi:transglutaminase-like putative cysteine protease